MWLGASIVRSCAMSTETLHASRWRWPSVDAAWASIGVLVPVIVTLLTRTMAIDLAYQIRAGRDMLASHAVASVDTFTFTQGGQPWLNQQWGAQVLLGAIYQRAGWAGILTVRGLLVLVIVVLLYRSCRERGASPRMSALLSMGGWLTGIEIVDQLRPQQFACALFVLCVWILARRNRHRAVVWLIPIIVIVWANIHGSFPLAFVLLLFAWLEDRRGAPDLARADVLAAVAALAASLINPFGVRVWGYVWELSTHPVVSHEVAEWSPPTIHSWTGRFFFVTLFGVAAFLARRRPPAEWRILLELAIFAGFALLAIRGVVWWGLYWPVVISQLLTERERQASEDRSPMNALVIASLIAVTGVAMTTHLGTDPVTGGPEILTYAPTDLIDAAAASVPVGAHVFVDEVFASWSEFQAPDLPVAVDARVELFPKETWDAYLWASAARAGWRSILDRWDIQAVVLQPDQSTGLLSVIGSDPTWHLVLQTDQGSVYARS
jgi:hypothetical protein